MLKRLLAVAGVLILCSFGSANAGIITYNDSGPAASGGSGFVLGQSLTTPSGGPWHNITFNMVDSGGGLFALGQLYLLSQTYGGTPATLSSAAPGFLASAPATAGGVWAFDPSVTLAPDTQYFLFMDTAFTGTQIRFSGSNPYPGGMAYQADTSSLPFVELSSADVVFSLSGDEAGASVPEPGSAAMLFLAVAGVFLIRRTRRS